MLQLLFAFGIGVVLAEQCTNPQMNDATRQAMLDQHNHLRSMLALGQAATNTGALAPSGKNIYKMEWSCQLEQQSQEWANGCAFGHSPPSFRHGAGENIYMFWTSGKSPSTEDVGLDAGRSWWDELVKYGVPNPEYILTRNAFSRGIGHFSQMAWGATTNVGCGIAMNCTQNSGYTTALVVCEYLQSGNYIGEPIYELGNPCKVNNDCTTFSNSTCSVSEGLCIKGNSKSTEATV